MLEIKTNDVEGLLHLLLGTFAQGEEFYNQQREEIRGFFGDEIFDIAEQMLKNTRLYELLSGAE